MKEYKVEIVTIPVTTMSTRKYREKQKEILESTLSKMAHEGWNLINTISNDSSIFYLFLERDIREVV